LLHISLHPLGYGLAPWPTFSREDIHGWLFHSTERQQVWGLSNK
jgi:hypothetical protein